MRRPTPRLALLSLLALTTLGGCFVYGNPPPRTGDVAVEWAFEGYMGCLDAGVDSVLVSVRSQETGHHVEAAVACQDLGARITDFAPGAYVVHLEGLAPDGTALFALTVNTFIDAGDLTDLGLVTLLSTLPPLPVTGSLQLDWSFLYPQDEAITNCARAGVDYVELVIADSANSVIFDESIRCLDGPATIDNLLPGTYTVALYGLGAFQGRSVELYGAEGLGVIIEAARTTNAGVIPLGRNEAQFGDFNVEWNFGGNNDCAALGIGDVRVVVTRELGNLVDDDFTVACGAEPQRRNTFVPGDYAVELWATGTGGDAWYGSLLVTLGPGALANIAITADLTN